MSNSHGELFTEIGRLVLAANCGEAIDLGVTAKDLATRYQNLGISEETIAKVVSRSIGAVSLSLARAAPLLITPPEAEGPAPSDPDDGPSAPAETIAQAAPTNGGRRGGRRSKSKAVPAASNGAGDAAASKKSLFPSGVRLAVLT